MPSFAVFEVIARAKWGAKHGRGNATSGAKRIVVVHNDSIEAPSRSRADMTVEQESAIMRVIEHFHAAENGWGRIGYQWAVMQSGRIYEGIGWGRVGAHVANMNAKAIGVFFPINGTATSTNIYWSAGNTRYELENKRGGSRNYRMTFMGAGG